MSARKSKINTEPFKEMHKEFAYLLGYALADGNINKQRTCLNYVSIDKEHLEMLSNYFSVGVEDFKYKLYVRKNSHRYPNAKPAYTLNISSIEFCKIFEDYGIIPNKSYNCPFPKIPKEFQLHFLRGIFDGDGNLYCSKKSGVKITIAGNKETVIGIYEILITLGIESHLYYLDLDRVKIITIQGSHAINILKLMYENSLNLRLERKYVYYLNYLESRKINCILCDEGLIKNGTLKMCNSCKIITRRLKNRRNDHFKRQGIQKSLKDLAKTSEKNLHWDNIDSKLK